MSKWRAQADLIMEDTVSLYNRALTSSVKAGLAAAIEATPSDSVDSGNALYHWQVVANEKDRPTTRSLSTVKDLRATVSGGQRHPPVGYRRDKAKGKNLANKRSVGRFVRAREAASIDRHIRGLKPIRSFSLFHGLLEGMSDTATPEKYAANAGLREAGRKGVEAFNASMARYLSAGQVRKRIK